MLDEHRSECKTGMSSDKIAKPVISTLQEYPVPILFFFKNRKKKGVKRRKILLDIGSNNSFQT